MKDSKKKPGFQPKHKNPKNYLIKISENLHSKVSRQLQLSKQIEGKSQSKQEWVREAIEEKLKQEANDAFDINKIHQEKYLRIDIDDQLDQKVQIQLDLNRKFRPSFTRKEWLLEALNEKLARDGKKQNSL